MGENYYSESLLSFLRNESGVPTIYDPVEDTLSYLNSFRKILEKNNAELFNLSEIHLDFILEIGLGIQDEVAPFFLTRSIELTPKMLKKLADISGGAGSLSKIIQEGISRKNTRSLDIWGEVIRKITDCDRCEIRNDIIKNLFLGLGKYCGVYSNAVKAAACHWILNNLSSTPISSEKNGYFETKVSEICDKIKNDVFSEESRELVAELGEMFCGNNNNTQNNGEVDADILKILKKSWVGSQDCPEVWLLAFITHYGTTERSVRALDKLGWLRILRGKVGKNIQGVLSFKVGNDVKAEVKRTRKLLGKSKDKFLLNKNAKLGRKSAWFATLACNHAFLIEKIG